MRDFQPVGLVWTSSAFLVVNNDLPARNMADFLALARAKPGLPYASMGIGGFTHLEAETLAARTGLKFTHVPFKGGGDAVASVMRGDTAFTFASVGLIGAHVKSGKLRPLAVATATRSKLMPDVPSLADAAALPGYDFPLPGGWVVRPGTPQAIVDKLSAALLKAAQNPETARKVLPTGNEMTPASAERLGEIIRADVKKYAEIVKNSGARSE